MIEAMMLFGSAARDDADTNSDVDILAIAPTKNPFSEKKNEIELQYTNKKLLIKSAREGELFAIHLALEGKVIFDHIGIFSKFKDNLVIRSDYNREISWASDLAWFLYDYGMTRNARIVNRRIAWCVRTIAIANLAEGGRFIFSPKALIREYAHDHISALIDLRRSNSSDVDRKQKLSGFLRSIKSNRPHVRTKHDYIAHFKDTENAVALQTVNGLQNRMSKKPAPY